MSKRAEIIAKCRQDLDAIESLPDWVHWDHIEIGNLAGSTVYLGWEVFAQLFAGKKVERGSGRVHTAKIGNIEFSAMWPDLYSEPEMILLPADIPTAAGETT